MTLGTSPMLEALMAVVSIFIAYTLRKTDAKIDKTASDLVAHKLEVASTHSVIRAEAFRDFATKLELREVEKRMTASNKEVQIKLDRLIDRLIDNPPTIIK